jgi:hypothetical protein
LEVTFTSWDASEWANPDTQALAGSDVLHRECVVKTKMALILSESWQRREHEKQREKRSTQHDVSFEGGSLFF